MLRARSLRELLPAEAERALTLVTSRVAREALLSSSQTSMELVARSALVGEETWVLLFERTALPQQSSTEDVIVGRKLELAELDHHLAAADSRVLYVQGPLGIGKTALLRAFQARCAALGCPHFWIDAQARPPTPDLISAILGRADCSGNALEQIVGGSRALGPGRWVLFIDNFDAWQAVSELTAVRPCTQLPADCRIVMAARGRPDPRWWATTARTPRMMPLEPLTISEATTLASKLGAPVDLARDVARRAGGHPLCVVCRVTSSRTGAPLWSLPPPLDLTLTDRADWNLLEAAAVPARITEDVLAALFDGEDVAAAFDRLSMLAVRDPDRVGLRMPLVLREMIKNRLRERNPKRLSELSRRLATHLGGLLDDGASSHLVPVVEDFLDANEDNPNIRKIAGSRGEGLPTTRRAVLADREALSSVARELGGAEAAERLVRRFARGTAITCIAEGSAGIEGICQYVMLGSSSRAQGERRDDTELSAAFECIRQRVVLRPDELVLACLHWIGTDVRLGDWEAPSQALFRHLFPLVVTRPRPVATILVLPDRAFPLATQVIPGSEPPVAVSSHHVVFRDLRRATARDIFGLLAQLEGERSSKNAVRAGFESPISTEAVRQALLAIDDPERLAASSLLGLRILDEAASATATSSDRVAALARLLQDCVVALGRSTREAKHRELLEAVFFHKSGKHEKIAADLGMPYSTFRRHVSRALDRLTEELRIREESARRAADEQH